MRTIRYGSTDANAFAIIGIVRRMLRQIHGKDANEIIKEYLDKATSGDYENLKKVSLEYVPGLLEFEEAIDED